MIAVRILAAIPVSPAQPPGTGKFQMVVNWVAWGAAAACVIGVITAGALMAVEHHRGMGGGEHASRLGKALFGAGLIGAASAMIGAITG